MMGFSNISFRPTADLDSGGQEDLDQFIEDEKSKFIFIPAAKVGGIMANNTFLFARTSQRTYAIAKIAGIKICEA